MEGHSDDREASLPQVVTIFLPNARHRAVSSRRNPAKCTTWMMCPPPTCHRAEHGCATKKRLGLAASKVSTCRVRCRYCQGAPPGRCATKRQKIGEPRLVTLVLAYAVMAKDPPSLAPLAFAALSHNLDPAVHSEPAWVKALLPSLRVALQRPGFAEAVEQAGRPHALCDVIDALAFEDPDGIALAALIPVLPHVLRCAVRSPVATGQRRCPLLGPPSCEPCGTVSWQLLAGLMRSTTEKPEAAAALSAAGDKTVEELLDVTLQLVQLLADSLFHYHDSTQPPPTAADFAAFDACSPNADFEQPGHRRVLAASSVNSMRGVLEAVWKLLTDTSKARRLHADAEAAMGPVQTVGYGRTAPEVSAQLDAAARSLTQQQAAAVAELGWKLLRQLLSAPGQGVSPWGDILHSGQDVWQAGNSHCCVATNISLQQIKMRCHSWDADMSCQR